MAPKSRKSKIFEHDSEPFCENKKSFSFSSFSFSSFSFFSSSSLKIIVFVLIFGFFLSFYGSSFMIKRIIKGQTLSSSSFSSSSSSLIPTIDGKKVLIVVGEEEEEGGLNEVLVMELVKRGARVTVVRGREGEGGGGRGRKWEGRVREVKGDLRLVQGQMELVDEIEEPESRQDNGEGVEKTLAFAYFSRRVLLEGLLEKGFQGRVGGLGWGVDKEVKDFNGDFMYEKGDQMTNWIVANNALVLGFRKRNVQMFGINAPFQEMLSIVMGGGKGVVSTFSSYFLPSVEEFVEQLISVLFSEYIPNSHVFFNQFGEGIQVSPYLLDESNINFIWEKTDELLKRAKETKEEEDWWKKG